MKIPDPNLNNEENNEILKYEYEENPRSEFPVVKIPDPNLNNEENKRNTELRI